MKTKTIKTLCLTLALISILLISYQVIAQYHKSSNLKLRLIRHTGMPLAWKTLGNELYFSKDYTSTWIKELTLPFNNLGLELITDKEIRLWDGVNYYTHTLGEEACKPYELEKHPLKDFLAAPIQALSIKERNRRPSSVIKYTRKDEKLVGFFKEDTKHEIAVADLMQVLQAMNNEPLAIPTVADFKFTEKDKQDYIKFVDEVLSVNRGDRFDEKTKTFYHTIPDLIKTESPIIIKNIIDEPEQFVQLSSYMMSKLAFVITITNANEEKLLIYSHYNADAQPLLLPWTIEYNRKVEDGNKEPVYKKTQFKYYNVKWSHFVDQHTPKGFFFKQNFNNVLFLAKAAHFIADYRGVRRVPKERADFKEED